MLSPGVKRVYIGFLGLTFTEGDRKKAGEIVEIVQNQTDERQIAPSRSPLKDFSVCGEVGDLIAVSGGPGKSEAHLPRFFSVSGGTALRAIAGDL
jgi:hypothetical protein